MATAFSIEDLGTSVGLGTTDLKGTTINVVQWILGLLALVALAIMLVGFGLNWLGSGDSEVVRERSKKVISGALIGLIVVLLAWAIVVFVAGTTKNVTS